MRYFVLMVAAAAIATGTANASTSPSLVLVRTSPLVIHGKAFGPHQAVKVSTPSGNVIVRASVYGQFTVTLPAVADRCSSGGSILAATTSGRTIVALHLPQPMCAPMRSEGASQGSYGAPATSQPAAARSGAATA